MSEMKCSETVNRNGGNSRWTNFQPCGRIAVKDGLCSLHLRVRDKQAEKAAAYQAKERRARALIDEAEALSKRLGIEVKADYSWMSRGYTGNFTVPGDWLRAQ